MSAERIKKSQGQAGDLREIMYPPHLSSPVIAVRGLRRLLGRPDLTAADIRNLSQKELDIAIPYLRGLASELNRNTTTHLGGTKLPPLREKELGGKQ